VQVDPINPTVKAPGAMRVKLICDILLSNSAFKFNLRRYTMEHASQVLLTLLESIEAQVGPRGLHSFTLSAQHEQLQDTFMS
jgi:hypothetical protein